MKIGIASPISSYYLRDFLDEPSRIIAEHLSKNDGPAVTSLVLNFLYAGHSLAIFTIDPFASKKYILKGKNITICVLPQKISHFQFIYNKLLYLGLIMYYFMKKSNEKVDIMSAHWTREYALASRYYLGKIPVTCTVRDIIPVISEYIPFSMGFKLKNEIVMRDKRFYFISNSEYTAAMVKKYWGHETTVIYNGLSDIFLDYMHLSNFDDFTFATVTSSIDERKNIKRLLEAYRIIHKENVHTRLLLIGPEFIEDNPYVSEWRKDGLLEGVKLIGRVDRSKLKEILTKSHCMVHPSLEETFGNTLIEAMACKCLTIGGKKSGAVPYVLKNGEYGLLCNVEDVNSMAEAMTEAVNKDLTPLIEAGFQAVHAEYSPKYVAQKYIDTFNRILKS